MTSDAGRHTPLTVIEDYFMKGIPGGFGIAGTPEVRLMANPATRLMSLRVPAEGRLPAITEFEHVRLESLIDKTSLTYQFGIVVDDNLGEVYALLCRISDRIQLSGETFADAVEAAMDSVATIVEARRVLTVEKQVGLFGELLTLLALAASTTTAVAVGSWRGPRGEEHDFGTHESDFEVKSTLGERRQHWISTESQLVPTPGRELHLLSIQLTTAGQGVGATLPELVMLVQNVFSAERAEVDQLLARCGYRDRDAEMYRSRWTLRTAPAFFPITDDFPAVTRARLQTAVPFSNHVVEIRYRLDLTGRVVGDPPFAFEPIDGVASGNG